MRNTKGSPFTRQGGVCEVQCSINELPLYFFFDTGASDVTISQAEATFMMKNKYLDAFDIIGRQNNMTAKGDITEGMVSNLRSIKFGDAVLSNVRASVVMSQRTPLLLGRSEMARLGKIEIGNSRKMLKTTYQEKE